MRQINILIREAHNFKIKGWLLHSILKFHAAVILIRSKATSRCVNIILIEKRNVSLTLYWNVHCYQLELMKNVVGKK